MSGLNIHEIGVTLTPYNKRMRVVTVNHLNIA